MNKITNSHQNSLLVYIVAYNAAQHIELVLDVIPSDELKNYEILISDDCSSDNTSDIVKNYQKKNSSKNIKLVTQKKNLGYGGNQKFGYDYAIKNNFYAVVLIHGDGQYSPKLIPQMMEKIIDGSGDVVLGSRMLNKKSALDGGMPFYKFIGNIILTKVQNLLLGVTLSEFHTGLRAYKTDALARVPFHHNSNGFSFDTDILIQMINNKMCIGEISIPTHYGSEICRVNGVKYACEIMLATVVSRLQRIRIFYRKKFDYRV